MARRKKTDADEPQDIVGNAKQGLLPGTEPPPPKKLSSHRRKLLKTAAEEYEKARDNRIKWGNKETAASKDLSALMHDAEITRFEYTDARGNPKAAVLQVSGEKLRVIKVEDEEPNEPDTAPEEADEGGEDEGEEEGDEEEEGDDKDAEDDFD